ncbi:hypothetical protein T09_13556 [Trichinella sp. T9]|nr:hypothetical protein T09_13556 [Trichinella sp. T9]
MLESAKRFHLTFTIFADMINEEKKKWKRGQHEADRGRHEADRGRQEADRGRHEAEQEKTKFLGPQFCSFAKHINTSYYTMTLSIVYVWWTLLEMNSYVSVVMQRYGFELLKLTNFSGYCQCGQQDRGNDDNGQACPH